MGDEYRRFRMASRTNADREWLLAEAFEAGAEGAEEKDEPGPGGEGVVHRAEVYARASEIEGVRERLLAVVAEAGLTGAEVGPAEAMAPVDWSEEWKRGLGPIEISPRLLVRPPFSAATLAPGQREIVIDPGQAFGTGTHASTHLCLEWIDLLLADRAGREAFDRMLDVGTGSGILALAAVALGAGSALGFDLDAVAIEAAEEAARANGLAGAVRFACLPIEEVPAAPVFPLIVANLLKREMLPIAGEIAERLAPAGSLVLAGLLEEDAAEVAARFGAFGLIELERRVREDPVGRWIAPRYGRASAAAPSRTIQSS
jgi:ribosomal protein L11 methyltransferase